MLIYYNMKEQIKKWLDSNYNNFLKKNQPLDQSVLDHIVDWMNSKEGESYLQRIDRVSVPAAIDLSKKWTILLNKKHEKKISSIKKQEGTDLIKSFENHYKIVKLNSKESFQFEGKSMGHCVSSYYDQDPDIEIYSLRDTENNPHCTIEFNKKSRSINQIKGKGNLEVLKKYHKYIASFLNEFEFEKIYSYDLKNIQSIYFGNYIFLNDEIPLTLEIKKDFKIELVNYQHTFDSLIINGDAEFLKNKRTKKIAKNLKIKGTLIIEQFHGLLQIADSITADYIEIHDCDNLKLIAKDIKTKGVSVYGCIHFNQKINNLEFFEIG